MAKFISTTFGEISGRHGTAVAAQRDGVSILKVFSPPRNPRSDKQLTQRSKFATVAVGLNPLRSIITIGFGSVKGYNTASSLALRNAVAGNYPDFTLDYSKVTLSSGSVSSTPVAHLVKKTGTTVTADWDTTQFSNGKETDRVNLVFMNTFTKMVYFSQEQTARSTGKLDVSLPSPWTGNEIHSWLFFTSTAGDDHSVSQYLAKITL
jgi:hypothetical protein